MEKAGFGIIKLAVIKRAIQEIFMIFFLAYNFCNLRQAPFIVNCTEGYGYRFAMTYIFYCFFFIIFSLN